MTPEVTGAGAGRLPSPMADLPVGATFGTLVHGVLEHTDPEATDLRERAARATPASSSGWWPVEVDREELADALLAVCDTPLGPLADGTTLRDDPAARPALRARLRVAAGRRRPDRAGRADVHLGDLAPLLRAHLPADDPLRGVRRPARPARLGDQACAATSPARSTSCCGVPAAAALRRRRLQDQPARRAATPRSPRPTTAPRRWPARCCTPTTRCRRCSTPWCCTGSCAGGCPATTPRTHLGGVLYLFLRGMCGPETPVVDGHRAGVFDWRPPVALVDGAVRPARRGARRMTEPFEPVDDARPPPRARRRRRAGDVQRRRACSRRADVHAAQRIGDLAGEADDGCCSPWRWPCGRCGTARSASTWPSLTDARRRRCPWPELPSWVGARSPRSPLAAGGRACAWSTACSTSTATRREEARCATTCVAALDAAAPGPSTRRALDAALGRVRPGRHFSAEQRAAAVRPRRGSGPRCSPAAPAPARPPRSRGCWRCSPTRPRRTTGGCAIALAAPTGKAAARLQEAVRAELAGLRRGGPRRVGASGAR